MSEIAEINQLASLFIRKFVPYQSSTIINSHLINVDLVQCDNLNTLLIWRIIHLLSVQVFAQQVQYQPAHIPLVLQIILLKCLNDGIEKISIVKLLSLNIRITGLSLHPNCSDSRGHEMNFALLLISEKQIHSHMKIGQGGK